MNIRWLYWSIYMIMASSLITSLFNNDIDAMASSFLTIIASFLLIAGAHKIET